MGHDSKGTRKGGSNFAVPGRNSQGVGSVGAVIYQKELGGDRGYAQFPDEVPPTGGATDHGDDGETWGWLIAGVPSLEEAMDS